jgi:hypothetical protein
VWFLQDPHGGTSQKTAFFVVTAMKTSHFKYILVIAVNLGPPCIYIYIYIYILTKRYDGPLRIGLVWIRIRDPKSALVNAVMNFQVPLNGGGP